MSVERDKGYWLIILKGEVVSPDAYMAQVAFNSFYWSLKGSLSMQELELLPLRMWTFKETVWGSTEGKPGVGTAQVAADTERQGVEIKKTKIQFEVRGQMREF